MNSNFLFLDKAFPVLSQNEEAVSQEVNFSQVLQEALLRTIHREEKED